MLGSLSVSAGFSTPWILLPDRQWQFLEGKQSRCMQHRSELWDCTIKYSLPPPSTIECVFLALNFLFKSKVFIAARYLFFLSHGHVQLLKKHIFTNRYAPKQTKYNSSTDTVILSICRNVCTSFGTKLEDTDVKKHEECVIFIFNTRAAVIDIRLYSIYTQQACAWLAHRLCAW